MLTSLHVRNFKAWADTGTIRLAPITVLFGTNSSGKSSIIQLLRMLRQTMESPDRRRVLHLGDRTTDVDLGTFHDVVHQHDVTRPITIGLGWSNPAPHRFESTIARDPDARALHVERFSYATDTTAHTLTRTATGAYQLDDDPTELDPPQRFYGFPSAISSADALEDLELALERQLGAIQYVGPVRTPPARTYVWSEERPESVGFTGQNTVPAMLAARERSIDDRPFLEVIADWLRQLGVVSEFRVAQLVDGRREHEVLVRTTPASPWVPLTDVGFGISQVLPVVVECFYVEPGSTVIVEQPEIHLHPAAQTGLADLFIDAIQAREHGAPRATQLIVESHSEHFLRRLQRRIAEERVSAADVAIYFCHSDEHGFAVMDELQLDEYGMIHNWPEGFFGDAIGEAAAQTRTSLQRRSREARP